MEKIHDIEKSSSWGDRILKNDGDKNYFRIALQELFIKHHRFK